MAKKSKSSAKGRAKATPSAPKAGVTSNGGRYGCGGKLKKA